MKYSIASYVETSYPAESGQVMTSLRVYDVLGSEVATLVNELQPAGNYEAHFVASQLESGVYFYILHACVFYRAEE
ncbi:MAG: hypothetical protein KF816_07355 [Melioribacteraceae bacterium]|nr:hypothetical protein [Melioribacteraceae bacterium]